jgi:hypothetical protein
MLSTQLAAAISGLVLGSAPPALDAPNAQPVADEGGAKHACRGQNACKGQGGCKTDQHACRGQNACKGQGGCKH